MKGKAVGKMGMGETKGQDWKAIGRALADLLAGRRQIWLGDLLYVLDRRNQPLQKRELTGASYLAVLAYQLLSVSITLSDYVAVADAEAASGEFYDQVAGTHAGAVILLVRRYMQMEAAQRRTQFLLDVLKDLLGQEPDLISLMTLDVTAVTLDMEARAATMGVFGDAVRGREMLQQFNQSLQQKG